MSGSVAVTNSPVVELAEEDQPKTLVSRELALLEFGQHMRRT